MSAEFHIVWDFFQRTSTEVVGHGVAQPIWPDATLVERFVSADLSEEEKHELCDFLKTHPHYITYLVGRLRHAGEMAGGPLAANLHGSDPVF